MNSLDKQYTDLIQEHNNSRDVCISYMMKTTYGDKKDIVYNTTMANYWGNIVKDLRIKIINYEQPR